MKKLSLCESISTYNYHPKPVPQPPQIQVRSTTSDRRSTTFQNMLRNSVAAVSAEVCLSLRDDGESDVELHFGIFVDDHCIYILQWLEILWEDVILKIHTLENQSCKHGSSASWMDRTRLHGSPYGSKFARFLDQGESVTSHVYQSHTLSRRIAGEIGCCAKVICRRCCQSLRYHFFMCI